MAGKKTVLGKGLGALLNTSIAVPSEIEKSKKFLDEEVQVKKPKPNSDVFATPSLVDVSKLRANSHQPRRVFKEEDLEDLSRSIKENGIIQPIVVSYDEDDKMFEIIAGERRFRAAQKAGLARVPVVVKKVTKKDKLVLAIIENVQRSNLNCIEEALAYFQLMEDFKLTQEEVAKQVGKDRSAIANFLRILKLPKDVIILLQKELLTFGHGKILAGLPEKEALKFSKLAIEEKLSVRNLELAIKEGSKSDKKLKPKSSRSENIFNERLDAYKQKLERKTGFHINLKSKKGGKGQLVINYNSPDEFNEIFDYLMS